MGALQVLVLVVTVVACLGVGGWFAALFFIGRSAGDWEYRAEDLRRQARITVRPDPSSPNRYWDERSIIAADWLVDDADQRLSCVQMRAYEALTSVLLFQAILARGLAKKSATNYKMAIHLYQAVASRNQQTVTV